MHSLGLEEYVSDLDSSKEFVSSLVLFSKTVDELRFEETFSTVTLLTIKGSICRVDFVSDKGACTTVLNTFELGSGGGGGGGL